MQIYLNLFAAFSQVMIKTQKDVRTVPEAEILSGAAEQNL
jgi:hypothetical protein